MSVISFTVTYTQCDCCKKTDEDNDTQLFEEFDDVHICEECLQKDWVILSDYDVNYEKEESDKKELPEYFFIRMDEKGDYDFSQIIPIKIKKSRLLDKKAGYFLA